ncbi:hypothetical protein LTR10_020949 [Elasticomyces elasticus]|uniref:F-box domain-containing protein n=1 Tax=Exophiala sideris TaxID=1016849 RepID=A0ABR0JBX0_9EURO|nr:hypothetical protein LTR10_020949 [Elasticomyces elasticus]KAK5031092.1 hypothetical protein LTS07_004827 [Exophiala sideris]KAK5038814.1 hypothetical protein LTR13_003845 [Exophiala sideris]KAK5060697.1 hypothetical protein LTR69_005296 [Exophiala sideris]KAK5183610.1 hypothetical protein LTR44_003892 [Eurotiomycetes sp. CCFEE 6388]
MATLPSVVLRTIATQLIDDLKDDPLREEAISTLCSLRLTCRELAEMGLIKAVLFSSINFHGTKNNMLKVERTDFRAIGPFIRQINFFPSPYFNDLSTRRFKTMLDVHYALLREPGLCWCCSIDSFQEYIEGQFVGRYPLSQDEISMRYQAYKECALDDQHSAIDGSLAKVWATMLQFSRHVDTIKLCPVSKALSQMPYRIAEIAPGACDCLDNVGFIDSLAGGSGDCLFTAVGDALASTFLPVRTFSIECELKNSLTADWRALHWETPILEQVETLIIGMVPFDIFGHQGPDREVKADRLFSKVLKKVHNTVQRIILIREGRISDFLPLPWDNFNFSCLRYLEAKSFMVDLSSFIGFIATCAALDMLSLEKCGMDGPDREWKDFFDSVRERPRALQLTLYENWPDTDDTWSFDSRLGINAGSRESMFGLVHLQKSLFLYLSGRAGWDTVLEDHFPQS